VILRWRQTFVFLSSYRNMTEIRRPLSQFPPFRNSFAHNWDQSLHQRFSTCVVFWNTETLPVVLIERQVRCYVWCKGLLQKVECFTEDGRLFCSPDLGSGFWIFGCHEQSQWQNDLYRIDMFGSCTGAMKSKKIWRTDSRELICEEVGREWSKAQNKYLSLCVYR